MFELLRFHHTFPARHAAAPGRKHCPTVRPDSASHLGFELSEGLARLLGHVLPAGTASGFADAVRLPELIAGVIKAGYLVSLLFAIFFLLEHLARSDPPCVAL